MTLQVFISYKSEYRDIAREVKQRLIDWQYETWLDVDSIPKGTYWPDEIDKGLISSDVLVGVVTKEAFDSRPIKLEWDYFLYEGKTILPCKYDDVKPPPRYITIQHIDFTKDKEKAFTELKERLIQLASQAVHSEPVREEAQKPGAAVFEDILELEKEEKEVVLDDFIGGAIADEISVPKPPPAPPQPIVQQSPQGGVPPLPPAAPAYQPQRQAEYIPQPAAVGRKRGSPLLWPLAAAASLVIIVGAVVLFSSNANVSLSTEPSQGMSPLVWVGVVVVVGAAGYVGWRQFGRAKKREGLRPTPTEDAQNRATMLQNVEDFWLKGVLDPALEAGTLEMGLSAAPGAVLRHKDYGDYALPANANILDVFNDLNRELLILGAPGSGKTVLLLQLARELIKQARNPHLPTSSPTLRGPSAAGRGGVEEPIPVVFNLSSWAAERKPLADWLVDELWQKYQVPQKVATAWVEGEKLLLLLDGLDEVAEQYRNECVDSINAYRQQYRTVDLAVCSRNEEYDALTSKLDVRGAIVLEPLSQPIIDAYLNRPGLASLQQVMANDKALQEMAHIPFLLNAMAYTYAGATSTALQFSASNDLAKTWRRQLFDRWTAKRLATISDPKYPAAKNQKWLAWLANKLARFNLTIFHIEGLQPNWPSEIQFSQYTRLTMLAFGLIYSLLFGTIFSLSASGANEATTIFLTVFAILIAFVCTILASKGSKEIALSEDLTWSWKLFSAQFSIKRKRDFQLDNKNSAILGCILGSSIFNVIIAAALLQLRLPGFIFIGFVVISIFVASAGIETKESIQSRVKSNQGIWRSLRFAFQTGILFGFIIFVPLGWSFSFQVSLFLAAALGASFGIFFGGAAVLQHFLLRFVLWRYGDAPWNYAQFLDYCVNSGLMRKVGSGYIFAHRYLMEYFAESSTGN